MGLEICLLSLKAIFVYSAVVVPAPPQQSRTSSEDDRTLVAGSEHFYIMYFPLITHVLGGRAPIPYLLHKVTRQSSGCDDILREATFRVTTKCSTRLNCVRPKPYALHDPSTTMSNLLRKRKRSEAEHGHSPSTEGPLVLHSTCLGCSRPVPLADF